MVLAKNVLANYVAQAVRILVGVGLVPLYVSILGAESFGLVSLFALLQLWMTFLDIGLKPAVTREIARFTAGVVVVDDLKDLMRSAEVLLVIVAVTCALAAWLASSWIAQHWIQGEVLSAPSIERALTLMGLVTGLRVLEMLYINSLTAFQRQIVESVLSSGLSLLRGFGSLFAIVFIHRSVDAYLLAQGLVSLVGLAAYAWLVYASMGPGARPARFSLPALMSIRRFAGSAAVLTVATLASLQVDKVIMSKLLTLENFGYYGLAGVVANVLQAAAVPLVAAFYPRLTELVARGDDGLARRAYRVAVQMMSSIMGSIGIAIVVFADVVIELWTQQPGLDAAVAVPAAFLTIAVLCQCLYWMPQYLQLAHGVVGLPVKVYLTAVAVIIPVTIFTGLNYGAVGASAALALIHAVTLLVAVWLMHRRLMTDDWLHWLIWGIGAPLGSAVAVAGLGRFLMPDGSDLVRLLWLAGVGMLMLAASASAAPDLRRELLKWIAVHAVRRPASSG